MARPVFQALFACLSWALGGTGAAAVVSRRGRTLMRITPALDPTSDKTFFKKDYPDDASPKVQHHFDHPFPTVQDSDHFDKDYVRDENDDGGEWKAQSEYDGVRVKLAKAKKDADDSKTREAKDATELGNEKKQEEDAEKHATEVEDKATKVRKDAGDVEKEVDAVEGDGAGGALGQATQNVEKEITDLEECKKQLAEARAKLKKMMEQRDAVEAKEVGTDAQKAAAEEEEVRAETTEADLEAKVAATENEHAQAKKSYGEQSKEVARLEKELEEKAKALRKFRKNVDKDGGVYRSSAPQPAYAVASLFLAMVAAALA